MGEVRQQLPGGKRPAEGRGACGGPGRLLLRGAARQPPLRSPGCSRPRPRARSPFPTDESSRPCLWGENRRVLPTEGRRPTAHGCGSPERGRLRAELQPGPRRPPVGISPENGSVKQKSGGTTTTNYLRGGFVTQHRGCREPPPLHPAWVASQPGRARLAGRQRAYVVIDLTANDLWL